MSMSGPSRAHHHDDDSESGPAVFADINITPLTDIFLVLLIIFMVTSTALVEQGAGAGAGVRVDLPKGAAREIASMAKDFPVAITVEGNIVVEGKVIDPDALKIRLIALLKDSPGAQVIIQADSGVHHGRVVEVMEVAKAAGVERLAIATEDK